MSVRRLEKVSLMPVSANFAALAVLMAMCASVHAKDSIWSERFGQAATVFEGKIWVAGGDEKGEISQVWPDENPSKSDVWSSEDGKKWTQATEKAPWRGRYDHSLLAFNGRLWVMGGLNFEQGRDQELCSDVWSSADGKKWDCVSPSAPWGGRSLQKTLVFKGKIWLIGGHVKWSDTNDVWVSDNGKNWQRALEHGPWGCWPPIGACVSSMPNLSEQGRMFVIALTGRTFGPGHDLAQEVGVWSSSDGVNWQLVDQSPTPLHMADAAVTEQKGVIWFFGGKWGQDDHYSAQIWDSLAGRHWTLVTCCAPWGERAKQNVVVLGKHFYLLGGMLAGAYTNDVWRSEDGRNWEQLRKSTSQGHWLVQKVMTSRSTPAFEEYSRRKNRKLANPNE